MNRIMTLLVACTSLLSLYCGSSGSATNPADPAAPPAPRPVEVGLDDVGLDAAAMDPGTDPCDDFFRYACGGWLDRTEIPADRSRYARFTEIAERNDQLLRGILDSAAAEQNSAQASADPVAAKLGAFYGACMDEAAIEKDGLRGIDDLLSTVRRIDSPAAVQSALAALHGHGIWAVFSAEALPDFKDSSTNLLFMDSDGLGLPDRDYYLKDDFADTRAFYREHVAAMLTLAGMAPQQTGRAVDDVLRVETALAEVTKTQVERRDAAAMYNKVDRDGLAALAPSFDWGAYFDALGRPALRSISVTTPGFFQRFDALLRDIEPRAWSHYLQWQLLNASAPALPAAFVNQDFALLQHLTGQPDQKPRWKRCVEATDRALGELLGQRFVEAAFAGNSKQAADAMMQAIAAAFAAELERLPWMSQKTRTQARAKLDAMTHLIGYPERWRTYDFEVDRASYARSLMRARAHEIARELGKVGQPYDRGEWHMTPQTVNASYNPLANQMLFPAGILQPPFFGVDRSVAANLGAIGMVMGHELTHGFDDEGARFDGQGNLENWWQPEDAQAFADKGQCLAAQYDTFEALPGVHVNGQLTLGENIADLGGVKLAFRAYRNLRAGAAETYVAGGLNEDQQFFVAVGQAWCSKTRDAEARRRIVVDPHAPPRFRVYGALRNLPEFAEAFQCSKGTPMHPTSTCDIW